MVRTSTPVLLGTDNVATDSQAPGAGVLRRGALAIAALALAPLCACSAEFQVRLGLVHGHLRETYFGCADGATDDFDRGHDDMAPPPGIETGYTAFIAGNRRLLLYRDIRGHADTVTWRFLAQVYSTKTIKIDWKAGDLPSEYEFSVKAGGEVLDMRKVHEIQVPKTEELLITARRRATPVTGEGKKP